MTELKNETTEDYIKRLESENNQMATVNNTLIMAIASTIPFKGEIGGSNISVIDQLYKLIDAYHALRIVWRTITDAWETSKYLDSGLYEDLTNKISEVLNDI